MQHQPIRRSHALQAKPSFEFQAIFLQSFENVCPALQFAKLSQLRAKKMSSARIQELEKELQRAQDLVEEAEDDHRDCLQMGRSQQERLETLLRVRDSKRYVLDVLRRQGALVDQQNENMQIALDIIKERRRQHNLE